MTRITLTFALCAALAGCSKKTDDTKPPEPTAAGSGSAGTVAITVPADAVDLATLDASEPAVEVPTEVDFEEQATTEITEQTLAAKLSALEKDLAP